MSDDGVGFQDPQPSAGERNCFGLFNIRERLKDHGGHLEIQSAAGQGTTIRITLPIAQTIVASP